jgi:hypothetical protein
LCVFRTQSYASNESSWNSYAVVESQSSLETPRHTSERGGFSQSYNQFRNDFDRPPNYGQGFNSNTFHSRANTSNSYNPQVPIGEAFTGFDLNVSHASKDYEQLFDGVAHYPSIQIDHSPLEPPSSHGPLFGVTGNTSNNGNLGGSIPPHISRSVSPATSSLYSEGEEYDSDDEDDLGGYYCPEPTCKRFFGNCGKAFTTRKGLT